MYRARLVQSAIPLFNCDFTIASHQRRFARERTHSQWTLASQLPPPPLILIFNLVRNPTQPLTPPSPIPSFPSPDMLWRESCATDRHIFT